MAVTKDSYISNTVQMFIHLLNSLFGGKTQAPK